VFACFRAKLEGRKIGKLTAEQLVGKNVDEWQVGNLSKLTLPFLPIMEVCA